MSQGSVGTSSISGSSAEIPDKFTFWDKTYSRHNLKKQSLYAIFFIISHTLDLFSYLDPTKQTAVFAYLTGGSVKRPTELEAFNLQQVLQQQMMANGLTAEQANDAAANLLHQAYEQQIEIGGVQMSLRNWITSFINRTFPQALQIPLNMVRHIFEISYKVGGSVWWGLKATEANLRTIAENHAGPMGGLFDVIKQSTAAGGALNFLSDLTIGQCFTISILILGSKYLVVPYGSGVLNFILGPENAKIVLSLPENLRNTMFGAVDYVVDYVVVTILSDAALKSLVLPGPELVEGEDAQCKAWGENAKNFLTDTGKFSTSSSTTDFDDGKAIFRFIDLCSAGVGAGVKIVNGFILFKRELEFGASASSASISSASTSSVSTSRLTDISVYKFIESVDLVTSQNVTEIESFITDKKKEIEQMLMADIPYTPEQEENEMISIAVSGGGAFVADAILNILVPSSCENVERSYSQVSSITQDESQESKVCVSSMQVIVNETIDDVIGQLEAEAAEAEAAKMDTGGRRRRTRKHRKSTKGRKTRKHHRVKKSRRSRKGRKSRKY